MVHARARPRRRCSRRRRSACSATARGTVLGVTYDDSTPDSLKFVKDYGLRYPNLRDVGTKLAEQYGTTSLPETFVIDAQGRIADFYRGQIDAARLNRALEKAAA